MCRRLGIKWPASQNTMTEWKNDWLTGCQSVCLIDLIDFTVWVLFKHQLGCHYSLLDVVEPSALVANAPYGKRHIARALNMNYLESVSSQTPVNLEVLPVFHRITSVSTIYWLDSPFKSTKLWLSKDTQRNIDAWTSYFTCAFTTKIEAYEVTTQ